MWFRTSPKVPYRRVATVTLQSLFIVCGSHRYAYRNRASGKGSGLVFVSRHELLVTVAISKVSFRHRILAVGTVQELDASIPASRKAASESISVFDVIWNLEISSLRS